MALNESYDDAQLITNVSNNSSGNVEQSSSDARAIILAKGAPKPVEQSDLRSKLSRPIREQVSPPRRSTRSPQRAQRRSRSPVKVRPIGRTNSPQRRRHSPRRDINRRTNSPVRANRRNSKVRNSPHSRLNSPTNTRRRNAFPNRKNKLTDQEARASPITGQICPGNSLTQIFEIPSHSVSGSAVQSIYWTVYSGEVTNLRPLS